MLIIILFERLLSKMSDSTKTTMEYPLRSSRTLRVTRQRKYSAGMRTKHAGFSRFNSKAYSYGVAFVLFVMAELLATSYLLEIKGTPVPAYANMLKYSKDLQNNEQSNTTSRPSRRSRPTRPSVFVNATRDMQTTNTNGDRWQWNTSTCGSVKNTTEVVTIGSVNLNETSMYITEYSILGNRRKQASFAVASANDWLVQEMKRPTTEKVPAFEKQLSAFEMGIGEYILLPGGHWKPIKCRAKWKVAILIPFRNRTLHLPIILRHLVPFLQKQQLEFGIFIVNQENDLLFNRAMLLNVGFLESLNFSSWDCFILHDVDYVPLSEFNYYGCEDMPRRMISGSNKYPNYGLSYTKYFGGVVGLTTSQIRKINGFPNIYWGWGGEDNEIQLRLQYNRFEIYRPEGPIAYYDAIQHHHVSAPLIHNKRKLVNGYRSRFRYDGLTNLIYQPPHIELRMLYTNISVDIQKIQPLNRSKR